MITANPHAEPPSTQTINSTSPIIISLFAAAIALAVLLPFLDYSPVFQVSEGREGVVVNELLSGSDYVLPLRHGEIVPSKPILFHWVSAVLASVAGEYDEFYLRLPSALGAVLCCAVVAGVVASVVSASAGLASALVLLTMYGFVHLAVDGRVDMLFVSLVTMAILVWIKAACAEISKGRQLRDIGQLPYLSVGLLSGLAMLTKGPLGIVLPALVVGCTALCYGGWRAALSLIKPGWFVGPLIAVPWYYMAAQSGSGSFVKRQIFFENIDRFFGAAGIPDKPIWYYLEHFWSQAAPWSLVFGLILVSLIELGLRRRKLDDFLGTNPSKRFVFFASLVWTIATFVLFSLSSGKRRGYLLAILPPVAVAIVIGAPLAFWMFKRLAAALCCPKMSSGWSVRAWTILHILTAVLAGLVSGVSLMDAAPHASIAERGWGTLTLLPQILEGKAISLALTILVLSALSLFMFNLGRKRKEGILLLGAVFCYFQIVFIAFVSSGLALKGEIHSYRDFAQTVRVLTEGIDKLHFVKERRDESFDCFFFYFQRRVLLHAPTQPLSSGEMYLSRVRRLEQLAYPPGMTPEILARGGRFVDKPEEELVLFKLSPSG